MTGGDECCFSSYPSGVHSVSCAGSVVLTQTHPAASYVCRTDNITIRCQYDGVEGVLNVLWNVDSNSVLVPLKVCVTHFPVIVCTVGVKQVFLCNLNVLV